MMLDLVRDSVKVWREQAELPTPREERIVSFDVTRGIVDGTCYLVFEDAHESPAVVAKVARTPAGKAIFRTEFESLRTLERIGMNESHVTTPVPLDLRETEGTLVALQSALPGTLIKNLPGRQVFSAEEAPTTIRCVMDWWEDFQSRYGAPLEPLNCADYRRDVIDPVEKFRRRFRLDDDESKFLERRFLDERRLEGANLPRMARHGDFCTANMVLRPEGVGVFDWEFALERKLPLFDLFFFFASTRFPYSGRRGESGHFESFTQVYWSENYMGAALRVAIDEACRGHAVPRECVADLFVISLIEVANMKFDAQLEGRGIPDEPDDWKRLAFPDKDAPFACIRDGVFENLRQVVRQGIPRF